jgi:hypothetical protein
MMDQSLAATDVIDWHHPEITGLARELACGAALLRASGIPTASAISGCPGCGQTLEPLSGDYAGMRLYCPQRGMRAGHIVAKDHGTPIEGPAHLY